MSSSSGIQNTAASLARRVPVPWGVRPRTPSPTPPSVGNVCVIEHGGVRWINVERPTAATIAYLRANFPFHELNLEDVLETLQRPKLDEDDDYLYLALQFPVHIKATRTTTASEVDVFIGRDYVITLHDARIAPLGRFFDEVERSPELQAKVLGQGAERLLYYILDRLIDYCVPIARRISQKIEQIDEMMFEPDARRTIEEIATVRRDVIATRRIIKPQVQIMNVLDRRVRAFFSQRDEEEIEAYYGDLVDGIAKIADLLEDAKEVIDSLSATADSLTSHRLNQVIKLLTILSVILLPLNLISSLYGMNVHLPGADNGENPVTFWILIAAMAAVVIGMAAFFRWRRWL